MSEPSDQFSAYDKSNPFPAPLLKKYNLNSEGSAKETFHAEISLEGSGLSYEAGDALGVIPQNASDLVDAFLEVTGLDGEEVVAIDEETSLPLETILRNKVDLRIVTKVVLTKYAKAAGIDELLEKCADREWAKEYTWGRDWVDVIKDYPAGNLSAADFVSFLRPLAGRLYSIASSILAHPNEVHLTVGTVRYEAFGRQKKGVCSTFISDMWDEGATAGVYFHHNKNFKLPEDGSLPVIMIGPGTGIAPFRAFIEERAATGATGKNWLFFGDQHEASDFLYKSEWDAYLESGALSKLDVAFSRDQAEKVYVQDRMRQNAAEIWEWISAGGFFYVCGDASRMAKDVNTALIDIAAEHGGMDEKEAAAYIKQMQKEKRYGRDVY